jgi:hypothetical protein
VERGSEERGMKKKVEPIYPLGAKVRIIAESAWEL